MNERRTNRGTGTQVGPRLGAVQEALRQSEELHRIILTNISDSVFLTDDKGNFTFICPNVDNIFGYQFNEIYGMKNISVLIGKDIYDPKRLTAKSEIRNVERLVKDKDGSDHLVLINVKKVKIKYGTTLFTCRDITEYKRVEQELTKNILDRKKVEKDLGLFFNLSADLFSITDNNRLRKVNPAWTAVLGYNLDELTGMEVYELIHSDDLRITTALESRMKAGTVVRYENRYRHKDGSYRWISWTSTMTDEGFMHAVGRDITVRKKEEDDIRRRLLKFRLQPGRTYLVDEPSSSSLVGAFGELLSIRYPGLVISRRRKEFYNNSFGHDFKYLWLAERKGKDTVLPDLCHLERLVEGLEGEHVVVLDSLEYLFLKCGYDETLSFVGHLREAAFFKNHIVLLGLDPSCLGKKEISFLEKETLPLERYPASDLPEDALILLRKIYEENSHGTRPTRTRLCKVLSLSHPTVRKQVAELKENGFIWEARTGRSVVVEITERGRRAIEP